MISDLNHLGATGDNKSISLIDGHAGNSAVPQCLESEAKPDRSHLLNLGAGNLPAFGISMLMSGVLQPVTDVPAYLATRTLRPSYVGEEALLVTLPGAVRDEVKALVRACEFCKALVLKKCSVQAACIRALQVFAKWGWNLKTFRPKFDLWMSKGDWTVLVNRAKAGALWWGTKPQGLPEGFLKLVEKRFASFKRADGKRQALISLKRQWQTGRDETGELKVVDGYEKDWSRRDTQNIPAGWSYSNIMGQIKKRARFTAATRALLHDSTSAAMQHLPQVLGTRRNLRFLEKITFDDVRTDWLIFNPITGQAEEMWVLVARDEATAMVLGFVMLPATVREDGKATHLGAQQMKELAGYILQTYPLPVGYIVHWVVERGTATLAEAVKLALGELFDNRIKVHYTSMIGGLSPTGYKEKKKGNSRGKASHESHNRLFHTQGSWIGGQTGNRWDIRPADLAARCKEAEQIYQDAQALPPALREQVKYPLPTPAIARDLFKKFCVEQNFRTDHKLEDFDQVLEVFSEGQWHLVSSLDTCPASLPLRKRMEMPVERAMRLIKLVEKWDHCSPDIIKTFLEHTVRHRPVETNGEINLSIDGKTLIFCHGGIPLAPGLMVLCYFHPDDPQFLHVTSGDGKILGTWYQRGRTEYLDQAALAQAKRYTHAASTVAVDTARELAAPETASLESMRQHNAELVAGCQAFTVTGAVPESTLSVQRSTVGTALTGVKAQQRLTKQKQQSRDDARKLAREALRNLAS